MDDSIVIGRPAPPLEGLVERYVGYRLTGGAPGIHRGLPSRFATFIVSIDRPIEVFRQTDTSQAPGSYGVVLSGLQATEAMIAHDGNQEGVAIELKPAGLRALFGSPARELWDSTVEMGEVDARGHELWERMQAASDWPSRFSTCDSVLTGLLGERRIRPELASAWDLIVGSGGRVPVEEIAHRVGFSRQYLTRRFREEFGLAPKLAAKVVRFERATAMLEEGSPPASAAAASGYFDQAHMNRDFRRLAGVTPARLSAERAGEFPIVQDGAA